MTDTLEKQVADLTRERDLAARERDAAVKRAEAAEAKAEASEQKASRAGEAHQGLLTEHKTASEQLAAVTKERDQALNRAERAEKAATAAGAKAKAGKATTPAGRKVAKPDWGENDVDRPKPAELLAAIEAADEVEVVASDGSHEIRELGAFQLDGNEPFRVAIQGLIANVGDGIKHGPGTGQGGSFRVEGFGLFLDGKLAAYAPLPNPIGVGAGQAVSFRDAVVF